MIRRKRAQAIVIQDACLLMVKHFDHYVQEEYWCLPGGGIEAGESPEQAVVRELQEETGLQVRVEHVLGEWEMPGIQHGYASTYTFTATLVSGELALGSDPEYEGTDRIFLQEVAWIPIRGELRSQLSKFLACI